MNYIGSKHRLSEFIKETIFSVVGDELYDQVFCDLFAGTGSVGRNFKPLVKKVISNDLEYYSYVLNRNYIENNYPLANTEELIDALNKLKPQRGFIFNHYCSGGITERQYFSDKNGQKIDAIRHRIEEWKGERRIDDATYYFLLTSLIESADKVANTASVYGAYLKKLKTTAQKELHLEAANFDTNSGVNIVCNEDSNLLIHKIKGDILYLDPPYNARQYGANYHILNTIALYDQFKPKGKTGLREYNRSAYCSKRQVESSFEELICNAQFKYIFLSYNNEGLMSVDRVREIMSKYGQYDIRARTYQRFKADKEANRNHTANDTEEYLHILKK